MAKLKNNNNLISLHINPKVNQLIKCKYVHSAPKSKYYNQICFNLTTQTIIQHQ